MAGQLTEELKVVRRRKTLAHCFLVLQEIIRIHQMNTLMLQFIVALIIKERRVKQRSRKRHADTLIMRMPAQVHHINRLVRVTDRTCIDNLRMDRNCFGRLCRLLRDVSGLIDQKFVTIEEQVAMFLGILSHHHKTRVIGFGFTRSSQTVSRYMHVVLQGVLNLYDTLLVKPEAIKEGCNDQRWKWFEGCLGALDGTYINVRVRAGDTPRYRTRKGHIATNTLAVCDRFLRFIYVLPGWEGSAADSRILRDALSRPYGLKVPKGNYYLCDNGYANSEGFITPYKGVRYHLKEWGPTCQRPQTPEEVFNLRHTKARNVIERAFAVLKMRWGILRSASFYPIEVQVKIIHACFLLHNYIRSQMEVDPVEVEIDQQPDIENGMGDEHDDVAYIDSIEPSTAWNKKRDDLAASMWATRHAY